MGALLERKVWLDLAKPIYPNLYVFLVGEAAVGKTRAIDAMQEILREIPEFYFSPTSVTRASLVDCLLDAKRSDPDWTAGTMSEYHVLYVAVDELQALMAKWNEELVAGLTKFYDGNHYSESRRTGNLYIEIDKPCLNVICGTTPSHLMNLVPDGAWEQGLTSRIILVYGERGKLRNLFDSTIHMHVAEKDLIHDAKIIHKAAKGAVQATSEYQDAFHDWRTKGCLPLPDHPRLRDYIGRRHTHVLKLSIISALDRGEVKLSLDDFRRASSWLLENETNMHCIFTAGATSVDDKAFDEIEQFVRREGKPVLKHRIERFASRHVPMHSLDKVVQLMIEQRRLKIAGYDKKTKQIIYLPGED